MAVTDPYRVLQVAPTAEQEVVNAAFRALALKYHPDRDPSQAAARRSSRRRYRRRWPRRRPLPAAQAPWSPSLLP